MRNKLLVFISSTSDLEEERRAVAEALPSSFDLYLHEKDQAGWGVPEQRIRGVIEDADVFVGVLGPNYGSALQSDSQGRSIVEWEFDTALARKDLPMRAFLKAGALEAATSERQKEFLARIKAFRDGSWCQSYTVASELPALVLDSLLALLADLTARLKANQPRVEAITNRWAIPVAGLAALLSVVAGLGNLLSLRLALVVCGLSFAAILYCYWLNRGVSGGDDG
jgi:hypothetical protein